MAVGLSLSSRVHGGSPSGRERCSARAGASGEAAMVPENFCLQKRVARGAGNGSLARASSTVAAMGRVGERLAMSVSPAANGGRLCEREGFGGVVCPVDWADGPEGGDEWNNCASAPSEWWAGEFLPPFHGAHGPTCSEVRVHMYRYLLILLIPAAFKVAVLGAQFPAGCPTLNSGALSPLGPGNKQGVAFSSVHIQPQRFPQRTGICVAR